MLTIQAVCQKREPRFRPHSLPSAGPCFFAEEIAPRESCEFFSETSHRRRNPVALPNRALCRYTAHLHAFPSLPDPTSEAAGHNRIMARRISSPPFRGAFFRNCLRQLADLLPSVRSLLYSPASSWNKSGNEIIFLREDRNRGSPRLLFLPIFAFIIHLAVPLQRGTVTHERDFVE